MLSVIFKKSEDVNETLLYWKEGYTMVIQDCKAQINLIERTLERLTEVHEPLGRHRVMMEAIEQIEMLRADLHLGQMELEQRAATTLHKGLFSA